MTERCSVIIIKEQCSVIYLEVIIMGRMKPEIRRQELLDIAFQQFIEKGYEKTSIRSIVGEAKGEIGMFYHHFSSKEEIFHEVLEQYNQKYVQKFEKLINSSKTVSFWEVIELILKELEHSLLEYSEMNKGIADKSVLHKLHQNTLILLQPILCELVRDYINRGEISPPITDVEELAYFITFGISSIIHIKNQKNLYEKNQDIILLLKRLLDKVV